MKHVIGVVDLLNRQTSAFEEAQVVQGLDRSNLENFEQHWLPMLRQRRSEFATNLAAGAANVQDWHWDWVAKSAKADRTMGYETFAIECDGGTQALMAVDTNKFAYHPCQRGQELVYISRLASAPWNRPTTVAHPKYKGAGRALVATAVSLSIDLEFRGRVGLHSLPQSESWYRSSGFAEVTHDEPDSGLVYFEMTEESALTFLKDGGR